MPFKAVVHSSRASRVIFARHAFAALDQEPLTPDSRPQTGDAQSSASLIRNQNVRPSSR